MRTGFLVPPPTNQLHFSPTASFARALDEARPYRPLFPLGAPDRDSPHDDTARLVEPVDLLHKEDGPGGEAHQDGDDLEGGLPRLSRSPAP
jgi:hypothetical protein